VSRCLGFAPCRYNGQAIPNRVVEMLGAFVEYRTVCPEVEIGLSIPRDPVRVVDYAGRRILYQPSTERDVTGEMEDFAESFLGGVGAVDGFILKNRSPSCGPWDVKVYKGKGKDASSGRGEGLFGGAVAERFPGKPLEDESRLGDFTVREHFLTRLFALAGFRSLKARLSGADTGSERARPKKTDADPYSARREEKARSVGALVDYHTRNKYLLMAYSQAQLKALGNIVAGASKKSPDEVFSLYETRLETAFRSRPARGRL